MADLANHIWSAINNSTPYLLSELEKTPPNPDNNDHSGIIPAKLDASITAHLLSCSTVALLLYVDVYINDFIALSHGGSADRRRVHDHVFQATEKVFRPNAPGNSMWQEPNSLKKLQKGDTE